MHSNTLVFMKNYARSITDFINLNHTLNFETVQNKFIESVPINWIESAKQNITNKIYIT